MKNKRKNECNSSTVILTLTDAMTEVECYECTECQHHLPYSYQALICCKDVNEKEGAFLTMSANGFGKKTDLKEYKVQKRGGSGIKTAKVTPKTGKLIVAKVLTGEEQELIAMSKKGQVIRTALKDISSLGRQTQGVTIMRLRGGDGIASLACI